MSILDDRLDKIEETMKHKYFRENKGLGNEVGYYIFDYPAKDELHIRERTQEIKNKINRAELDFEIVEFDLYDIAIEILNDYGYMDNLFELEKEEGIEYVYDAIINILGIGEQKSDLIRYIQKRISKNSVVFISGIGKCFPFIRSHKILNNLHFAVDKVPVILFFPGKYDGQELVLFSEIKDDNYYRAFRFTD